MCLNSARIKESYFVAVLSIYALKSFFFFLASARTMLKMGDDALIEHLTKQVEAHHTSCNCIFGLISCPLPRLLFHFFFALFFIYLHTQGGWSQSYSRCLTNGVLAVSLLTRRRSISFFPYISFQWPILSSISCSLDGQKSELSQAACVDMLRHTRRLLVSPYERWVDLSALINMCIYIFMCEYMHEFILNYLLSCMHVWIKGWMKNYSCKYACKYLKVYASYNSIATGGCAACVSALCVFSVNYMSISQSEAPQVQRRCSASVGLCA